MGTGTYLDWPDEASADEIGVRIVELFEDRLSASSTELPSLYQSVNVDAIEALIRHADGDETVFVQFEYCDEAVRVYGDGRIEIDG